MVKKIEGISWFTKPHLITTLTLIPAVHTRLIIFFYDTFADLLYSQLIKNMVFVKSLKPFIEDVKVLHKVGLFLASQC